MLRLPSHMIFAFVCLTCVLNMSGTVLAAEAPKRFVSMNVCSDQLLLLLAPREQIASLSYLAANPAFSPVATQTDGLYLNHGQAEEILPLAPDLILGGQFSATLATNLLERLGIEVLRLGVAQTADDIYAQLDLVAQHTGNTSQARVLINNMQTELAAHVTALRGSVQGKTAAFYSSNGFTYGSSTLQDAFIRSLGMHNAAAHMQGPAQLSLEALLRAAPDYLFINPPSALDRQLAHPLLQHQALAALQTRMQVIEIADQYFECASPLYLQAYVALARQL